MQRAKLFGALFAYVNNIQITWKTIHLTVLIFNLVQLLCFYVLLDIFSLVHQL
jgi:hypothetical protein